MKARIARCESLRRRAPHPAHLRCATLPLQGRVKQAISFSQRSPRPSFAKPFPKKNVIASNIPHQTNRRPLLLSSSKGRQNADRRRSNLRACARRASSGTRTPVGVPPRLSLRRTNATAQPQAALPGTWLKDGRYPPPPVPVQRASRRPVIMPAGRLPRAARYQLRIG